MEETIEIDIKQNRRAWMLAFNCPKNEDIVFRNFQYLGRDGFIVYLQGMVNGTLISDYILRPIQNASVEKSASTLTDVLLIYEQKKTTRFEEAVSAVLRGDSVLCVDDDCHAYICETKGFDHRAVDKPQVENTVLGAQEAFNENLRTNVTLLRRIIKSERLTTEMITVGRVNHLACALVYMHGITNTQLVDNVRTRVRGIESDFVQSAGMVEQFIEDKAFSLFQTVTTTERPDNAAAWLMMGRVVLIVDGSPRAIVAPSSLLSVLKNSEDTALRVPFSSTVRLLRLFAVLAALLLPALYLALTTYHPEMIPASLLLSIAASRLSVPFPSMFELLLLEISFELVLEAGNRIPGMLGNTIGIVGALILGEAAVSAGFTSQGAIVVIAFAGLSNFAIPQYQLAFTMRILRLLFIICAGILGFLGIAVAFTVLVGYLNSLISFGVDFTNPVFSGERMFPKKPVWQYEKRPKELRTEQPQYQPKISRMWKRGK